MAQTQGQAYLGLALRQVQQIAQEFPREEDVVRRTYGSLLHSFPVLVRTAGLAQALAYIQAKASEQKKVSPAYQRLFQHVAELLGQDPAVLQEHIASVDVTKYMYYTSKVLSALIYHKRFAVSVLKVTSARETEEDLDKEGTA